MQRNKGATMIAMPICVNLPPPEICKFLNRLAWGFVTETYPFVLVTYPLARSLHTTGLLYPTLNLGEAMQIRTALSHADTVASAITEIADGLEVDRPGAPDFIALHFGAGLPADQLRSAARAQFGSAALHGGTSCLGIMTQDGPSISNGTGSAMLAIWDPDGSYGTASADLGEDASAAARRAVTAALAAADRAGEVPEMVWLTVAPGREEQVLAGIRAGIGSETLIVGGSSADNEITGGWAQFGPDASHDDGVVVSVLFPSRPVSSFYQSGYAPTGQSGQVTRIAGRRLIEIDGEPAASVYHHWTNGAVPLADAEPVSVLSDATLWPLGRVARQVAGVPFHLLVHPATAHPDGSLDLFADLSEGDRIWQMHGSSDSLVARAGRIATQARSDAGGEIAGALMVYCGGCMLAVRDRMDEVQTSVNMALGETPWIGIFTFGEQGVPEGGEAEHGNLMISCTVFAE